MRVSRSDHVRNPRRALLGVLAALMAGAVCLGCSRSGGGDGSSPGESSVGQDSGRDALPPPGLSRCIADWPAGPAVLPVAKPSLAVEAPKLLWVTKTQSQNGCGLLDCDGMAKAGDRIALHSSSRIAFFDKQGGVTEYAGASLGSQTSGVTSDEQGNVYFAAPAGVFSLDATGTRRWFKAYGAAPPEGSPQPGPLALSPDGVLYGVASDGMLRAMRASDGELLWSQPTETWSGLLSKVVGGAGDAVFVGSVGGSGVSVFDTKNGTSLGRLEAFGAIGMWALGWTLEVVSNAAGVFVFDRCGRSKWSTFRPNQLHTNTESGVITLGELLVGMEFQTDNRGNPVGDFSLSLYDADGQVKVGPAVRDGQPFLAGADGTIYTVYSRYAPSGTSQLIAYAPDLTELWRLDIGGPNGHDPGGNGVLDTDGVLYLAQADERGVTQLLAIQTSSPGLADSSWPSLRHDNRGTSWLVPWAPSGNDQPGTSDAAVSDAIDAPADTSPFDAPTGPATSRD